MNKSEEMMELVTKVENAYELSGMFHEDINLRKRERKSGESARAKLQTIADSLEQGQGELALLWISVKDRLPEINELKLSKNVDVWVRGRHSSIHYGRIPDAYYDGIHGWCINAEIGRRKIRNVTYWREQPEPPKADEL